MINSVLHDLLDEGVIAYIDEILIYSEREAEYTELVKKVLQRLREAKLYFNIKKSVLHSHEVENLIYQITANWVSISVNNINGAKA